MAQKHVAVWMLLLLSVLTPDLATISESAKPCAGQDFNLIFVIDSSGSIKAENYPNNFIFVNDVLREVEIGQDKTRVSLITFGSNPRLVLNNTGDEAEIKKKLENVEYQDSTTQTGKALKYVLNNGLAGETRSGVETVVIVVTDGKSSNKSDTLEAADLVKQRGFTIFTIGVTKAVSLEELHAVATKDEYVILIDDYSSLGKSGLTFAATLCQAISGGKPATTQKPEPEITTSKPVRHYNLVFVIDSSSSIGEENYPSNFIFAREVINQFDIGEDKTRVAMATFGTSVKLVFNNTGDKDFIEEKTKNVPFQKSTTHTERGLRYVIEKGLAGSPREGITTVVILVTDGKSSVPPETLKAAQAVKDAGYVIVAVGVGKKVDWDELNQVATTNLVYKVGSYDELKTSAVAVADVVRAAQQGDW